MDTAGRGALQHLDTALGRQSCQADHFIGVRRAHLDPATALTHGIEYTVGSRHDFQRGVGRGQAGDQDIDLIGGLHRRSRTRRPLCDKFFYCRGIKIENFEIMAGLQNLPGHSRAQHAKANESALHNIPLLKKSE